MIPGSGAHPRSASIRRLPPCGRRKRIGIWFAARRQASREVVDPTGKVLAESGLFQPAVVCARRVAGDADAVCALGGLVCGVLRSAAGGRQRDREEERAPTPNNGEPEEGSIRLPNGYCGRGFLGVQFLFAGHDDHAAQAQGQHQAQRDRGGGFGNRSAGPAAGSAAASRACRWPRHSANRPAEHPGRRTRWSPSSRPPGISRSR